MLKRIYIDNFKCLVNFELTVESMNLFLGANGTGKTTLFLALLKLQQFIVEGQTVTELFKSTDLTKWQDFSTQSFELEIAGNGGVYKYSLAIEHQREQERSRMLKERLWFDDQLLFYFNIQKGAGMAQLYHDDYTVGPEYPVDWSRSGIAALQERLDNKKLTWFKKRIAQFLIVRVNPTLMNSESRREDTNPTWEMSNYVAWFRYLSQDQGTIFKLTQELREILPSFEAFKIISYGKTKILSGGFFNQSDQAIYYEFEELSDGQRVLIALYTLLYCMPNADYTLCLDEPENFLALPEIQPWLDKLYDQCEDKRAQALLISHHPEIINYLASDTGYWFSRQNNGPVRTVRVTDENDTGLSIAELVARGWIYEN
jgi:predicted ATPase